MTLYEIDKAIMEKYAASIDPETGEIADGLEYELEGLNIEREQKLENIGLLIKNLNAEATACKNEAKAFTERAKSAEAKAEWLKAYIDTSLNGTPFKTDKIAVTYRKTTAVEVDFPALCASEDANKYLRFKEPEPDKVKIKEALKAGGSVAGCMLVERNSMSIK